MTLWERIRLVRGKHPQREFAKMVEVRGAVLLSV